MTAGISSPEKAGSRVEFVSKYATILSTETVCLPPLLSAEEPDRVGPLHGLLA